MVCPCERGRRIPSNQPSSLRWVENTSNRWTSASDRIHESLRVFED